MSNALKEKLKCIGGETSIGGLKLVRTTLLDIATFVGAGWTFLSEEREERSHLLAEIDLVKARFKTCLKDGETSISGEEKLKRLKSSSYVRLGANVFYSLWIDYKERGWNSVLEQLRRETDTAYLNFFYLDFFGDVLRNSLDKAGCRYVLYLQWRDDQWHWGCCWLGGNWHHHNPSVVLESWFSGTVVLPNALEN
jgi:hypothetical protein